MKLFGFFRRIKLFFRGIFKNKVYYINGNDNLPPPHAKNPQPVGCGFPVYLGIVPSASASLNSKL